jgi:hypothetical protein
MSTAKKTASSYKAARQTKLATKTATLKPRFLTAAFLRIKNSPPVVQSQLRIQSFLARRPHRSFQRTYRRDYVRSLDMPGYWSFTNHVRKVLWGNRKLFLYMALAYMVATIAITNLSSEDLYVQMRETVNESGTEMFNGFWGELGKAGLLLVGGVTGSYNATAITTETQIYIGVMAMLTWLTTVWLLRAILAGRKPKMRDGLYNAGAPIVSTFLVLCVLILQLLPLALALFGYNSALASGLLEGGVEAMLFWSVAAMLFILSLYWITSTFIALVVVTLPGMYPLQALRTAGDLVVGRRVRILLRTLWMIIMIVIAWVLIAIPIILFDAWLKSVWLAIAWLPLVPVTLLILGSITIVWAASYIYLLYRRIVEDDALPA